MLILMISVIYVNGLRRVQDATFRFVLADAHEMNSELGLRDYL